MTTYAIISLGGKQYRVQAGQRLLVDRLPEEEGATITPRVLLVGGDGDPVLGADGAVKARVLGQERGPKLRIGKYRQRTGFRKHTGFRAALTQIEIESIGAAAPKRTRAAKPKVAEPEAATAPAETGGEAPAAAKPKRTRAAKPKSVDEVVAPAQTQEEES